MARLSKKLVTLDDNVKLDVPLADLAVHEPDYKRLIAFLKAMEFTTLTRRVAEFSGVDAGEIEPDETLKARRTPAATWQKRLRRRGQGEPASPRPPSSGRREQAGQARAGPRGKTS